MANFPGSQGAVPSVYSSVNTINGGVSLPGSTRQAALIGEGNRSEVLISSAIGSGNDGLNPSYSSSNGRDGRHFNLSTVPVIENRTQLFVNGIPLQILESPITTAFSNKFDAQLDISTGHIQLQTAYLVDQGGSSYLKNPLNTGNGTINGLNLIDLNTVNESWQILCSSVRRDGYGMPIDGYANFTAIGSVSGNILDAYGNAVVWQSNGTTKSNSVLQFSITEGATAFVEGDRFTIKVESGVLSRGDSLTATYIATADINDVEFMTDMNSITAKHGSPSLTNRLSLGCQLAFANSTPGVWTCEAAPSVPRRTSYELMTSAKGSATISDLTFPLPLNVTPDVNSKINFFVTDPTTGVETQILPNKVNFYNPTFTASPSAFVFGPSYIYSYTVVLESAVEKDGIDGYITHTTSTQGTLSSASVMFGADDISAFRSVFIYDAVNSGNNGTATIVSVANGVLTINKAGGFVSEGNVRFEVLDSSATSASILFTDDLALSAGQSLRATVVDEKDAGFFDAGWINAYSALEVIDVDMVCPLPSQTISVIFQNGLSHCTTQSNIMNKHERILFIGAIQGLTPDNLIGNKLAAVEDIGVLEGIQGATIQDILSGNIEDLTNYKVQDAFGSTFRCVYFWPDQIVVNLGGSNTFVDGFFQAAAAVGFFSGTPYIATPLTKKTLGGFSILRNKLLSPITLSNLAASGVTILQPVLGGGEVVWGKTTTDSGFPEEQEISIVFIRDYIAKAVRAAFAGYVGNAETPTIGSSLFQKVDAVAKSFVSSQIITAYKDITVKRDATDPTQWNVTLAVQPTYPVNFIYIQVGIGILG